MLPDRAGLLGVAPTGVIITLYNMVNLVEAALVALGGAVGAVLRYGVGACVQGSAGSSAVPWHTLVVNLLGCLLLGVLVGWEMCYGLSQGSRALLIVGLCGGYTTFSTFSLECLRLLTAGAYMPLVVYLALSLVGGFALVALGIFAVRAIFV